MEASQEVIVDLQQTIEKFRDLVRNQQTDILELRQKGASERGQELASQSEAIQSLNRQLQATTVKAHSRVRMECGCSRVCGCRRVCGCGWVCGCGCEGVWVWVWASV